LGVLPGDNLSEAVAINNTGQIAGNSTGRHNTHAFLWSAGAMQSLGTLPDADSSKAYAINDAGQIVGSSGGPNGTRAFLYTPPGELRDLGLLPGGDYSEAFAINSKGVVVGTSGTPLGTRAFIWDQLNGMQDLNELMTGHPNLVLPLRGCHQRCRRHCLFWRARRRPHTQSPTRSLKSCRSVAHVPAQPRVTDDVLDSEAHATPVSGSRPTT
jgi:probable HAF family extracellular repeat protein